MIVKWFKHGVILTQGTNSSILVINATKRSDSGTYRCSATNELVQIQRWFNLSVLCKFLGLVVKIKLIDIISSLYCYIVMFMYK